MQAGHACCSCGARSDQGFCKECTCILCGRSLGTKDEQAVIRCEQPQLSSAHSQEKQKPGCRHALHALCALSRGLAGVVTAEAYSLDGEYICQVCGLKSDLLRFWRDRLLLAVHSKERVFLELQLELMVGVLHGTRRSDVRPFHERVERAFHDLRGGGDFREVVRAVQQIVEDLNSFLAAGDTLGRPPGNPPQTQAQTQAQAQRLEHVGAAASKDSKEAEEGDAKREPQGEQEKGGADAAAAAAAAKREKFLCDLNDVPPVASSEPLAAGAQVAAYQHASQQQQQQQLQPSQLRPMGCVSNGLGFAVGAGAGAGGGGGGGGGDGAALLLPAWLSGQASQAIQQQQQQQQGVGQHGGCGGSGGPQRSNASLPGPPLPSPEVALAPAQTQTAGLAYPHLPILSPYLGQQVAVAGGGGRLLAAAPPPPPLRAEAMVPTTTTMAMTASTSGLPGVIVPFAGLTNHHLTTHGASKGGARGEIPAGTAGLAGANTATAAALSTLPSGICGGSSGGGPPAATTPWDASAAAAAASGAAFQLSISQPLAMAAMAGLVQPAAAAGGSAAHTLSMRLMLAEVGKDAALSAAVSAAVESEVAASAELAQMGGAQQLALAEAQAEVARQQAAAERQLADSRRREEQARALELAAARAREEARAAEAEACATRQSLEGKRERLQQAWGAEQRRFEEARAGVRARALERVVERLRASIVQQLGYAGLHLHAHAASAGVGGPGPGFGPGASASASGQAGEGGHSNSAVAAALGTGIGAAGGIGDASDIAGAGSVSVHARGADGAARGACAGDSVPAGSGGGGVSAGVGGGAVSAYDSGSIHDDGVLHNRRHHQQQQQQHQSNTNNVSGGGGGPHGQFSAAMAAAVAAATAAAAAAAGGVGGGTSGSSQGTGYGQHPQGQQQMQNQQLTATTAAATAAALAAPGAGGGTAGNQQGAMAFPCSAGVRDLQQQQQQQLALQLALQQLANESAVVPQVAEFPALHRGLLEANAQIFKFLAMAAHHSQGAGQAQQQQQALATSMQQQGQQQLPGSSSQVQRQDQAQALALLQGGPQQQGQFNLEQLLVGQLGLSMPGGGGGGGVTGGGPGEVPVGMAQVLSGLQNNPFLQQLQGQVAALGQIQSALQLTPGSTSMGAQAPPPPPPPPLPPPALQRRSPPASDNAALPGGLSPWAPAVAQGQAREQEAPPRRQEGATTRGRGRSQTPPPAGKPQDGRQKEGPGGLRRRGEEEEEEEEGAVSDITGPAKKKAKGDSPPESSDQMESTCAVHAVGNDGGPSGSASASASRRGREGTREEQGGEVGENDSPSHDHAERMSGKKESQVGRGDGESNDSSGGGEGASGGGGAGEGKEGGGGGGEPGKLEMTEVLGQEEVEAAVMRRYFPQHESFLTSKKYKVMVIAAVARQFGGDWRLCLTRRKGKGFRLQLPTAGVGAEQRVDTMAVARRLARDSLGLPEGTTLAPPGGYEEPVRVCEEQKDGSMHVALIHPLLVRLPPPASPPCGSPPSVKSGGSGCAGKSGSNGGKGGGVSNNKGGGGGGGSGGGGGGNSGGGGNNGATSYSYNGYYVSWCRADALHPVVRDVPQKFSATFPRVLKCLELLMAHPLPGGGGGGGWPIPELLNLNLVALDVLG